MCATVIREPWVDWAGIQTPDNLTLPAHGEILRKFRVLIADDHPAVRSQLRSLLSISSTWDVCGDAVDGIDAVEKANALHPDLVLMDVSMPRMSGLEAIRIIQQEVPTAKIVIVSQNDAAIVERQAKQVNADAFVVKADADAKLLTILEEVFATSARADQNGKSPVGAMDESAARHLLEIRLRESEQNFRSIIDALPAAIYTTDAEGKLTHFNPAAAEFFGRTPDLFRDRWCVSEKLFRSDGTPLPLEECSMARALREERIVDGQEVIVERPDGTRRWFTPYPRVLRNATGEIVGGINMLVDITERKEAEETSNLLAAIVDSSDDAIVSKNLDGVVTSWNKGAERLFGYSAQEVIGQNIKIIIPKERYAEETDILSRIRRGERIDHFETVRVRKDGQSVHIAVTISPVRNAAGAIIGASKVARDITAAKNIDEALRRNRERLTIATDASQMGIWLCDLPFDKLEWDDRVKEHFWLPPDAKVSIQIFFDRIHPEDRERTRAAIEKSITTNTRYEIEYRTVSPDGEIKWIRAIGQPSYNSAGVPTYFDGVTLDMTQRKRDEQKLIASEDRFRKLAKSLDEEVRLRTRELEKRTADVSMQSERVRDLSRRLMQIQDNERRHIARELHDSAGQTLTVLAMNLAQLTQRLREHAAAAPSDLLNAATMAEEMVQQLTKEIRTTSYLLHPPLLDENGLEPALNWYVRGLIDRSGLDIQISIQERFGRLTSELELAIFRVVQECLTNIHRHSTTRDAAIRLERRGETVFLEILDHGKGISPERLAEIQSKGAGVGIRGMAERVQQFGGDLHIESDASGTRVTVTFPMPPMRKAIKLSKDQPVVAQ